MIIGNNNNNNINNMNKQNNSFNQRLTRLKEDNKINDLKKNMFIEDNTINKHTDPTNQNDMYDKTLAMLNERLQKGTITLEEFNKKCSILGQKRQKQ